MKQITFLSSTSSNYLFGKGRGKDKKKRKTRNLLIDAKDFVVGGKDFIKEANIKSPKDLIDMYQARKDNSSVAINSGIALGASQSMKAGIGSGVGIVRGFRQKNKKKDKI